MQRPTDNICLFSSLQFAEIQAAQTNSRVLCLEPRLAVLRHIKQHFGQNLDRRTQVDAVDFLIYLQSDSAKNNVGPSYPLRPIPSLIFIHRDQIDRFGLGRRCSLTPLPLNITPITFPVTAVRTLCSQQDSNERCMDFRHTTRYRARQGDQASASAIRDLNKASRDSAVQYTTCGDHHGMVFNAVFQEPLLHYLEHDVDGGGR